MCVGDSVSVLKLFERHYKVGVQEEKRLGGMNVPVCVIMQDEYLSVS